ncbi:MAG TPA: hypothetical protein VNK52_10695 [Hyphomicrobiaceae bacterium]|nr:hypothetical protein [Hyphomicrobiaceae bacterium]
MPRKMRTIAAAAIALAAALLPTGAATDDIAEFYRSNRVRIVAGHLPGTAGDAHARLLGRHLGRYLPGGSVVIVQNMPGAGGLIAANYLYAAAPADGSVLATFSHDIPMLALLGENANVRFDPLKLGWLGSSSGYEDDALLLLVHNGAGFATIEDARGESGRELVLGVTGEHARGSDVPVALREPAGVNLNLLFGGAAEEATSGAVPHLLRQVLGLNLKVISGFPDSNAIDAAIARGEIDGRMASLSAIRASRPQWLGPSGSMRALMQFGRASRHPAFAEAPTARELAGDEATREIIALAEMPYMMSRAYATPPGVPPARAHALASAFAAVHDDAGFRAGAARLGFDVSPIGPEQLRRLLGRIAEAPAELRDRLRKVRAGGGE